MAAQQARQAGAVSRIIILRNIVEVWSWEVIGRQSGIGWGSKSGRGKLEKGKPEKGNLERRNLEKENPEEESEESGIAKSEVGELEHRAENSGAGELGNWRTGAQPLPHLDQFGRCSDSFRFALIPFSYYF